MMYVEIVRAPLGEAPEWVRQAWVGLRLPAAGTTPMDWEVFGVLSRPPGWLAARWARWRGREQRMVGYAVEVAPAVAILAESNPQAADWWRLNTPELLQPGQIFIFDIDACRPGIAGQNDNAADQPSR